MLVICILVNGENWSLNKVLNTFNLFDPSFGQSSSGLGLMHTKVLLVGVVTTLSLGGKLFFLNLHPLMDIQNPF